MKNVFALFVFFMSYIQIFPQTLTPEEKTILLKKISEINSYDYDITGIYDALETIQQYKVYEAIPVIDSCMWKAGPHLQSNYLETLVELNAPEAKQMIYAYYDTLNNYDLNNYSRLFLELFVNELLFKYNDFSKTSIVFSVMEEPEYINDDALHIFAIRQLPEIIKNAPEYESRAKALLEWAVTSEVENQNRYDALYYLGEIYKYDAFPFMKTTLEQDSCAENRLQAIYFAELYPTSEFISLLKDALYYEIDSDNLITIYRILLFNYCCPFTYNYLLEYLPTEPDAEAQNYLQSRLSHHAIRRPDESKTIINLVDSLSSYIPQCSSLSWVDTSLANTLATLADSAKTYLVSGDSISCAKQLVKLKQKADYEFADSLNVTGNFITENGRIFINAYTQHILDRLPAAPVELNFNIKIPNNSGTFGEAVKEPLPANLSFRAAYTGTLKDKVQNTAEIIHLNSSSHN